MESASSDLVERWDAPAFPVDEAPEWSSLTLSPTRVEARPERLAEVRASGIYWPALSIVAVLGVLVGIGWWNHWGGASFPEAMTGMRAHCSSAR